MTLAEIARTNGHDLTDAEARAAAEDLWRRSQQIGEPLTGAQLGRAFGKTDRWGRKRIERARGAAADLPAFVPDTAPAPVTGTPPVPVEAGAGTVIEPDRPAGTLPGAEAERAAPAGDLRSGPSWWDQLAVIAVALVAAGASYGHMYEVAQMAGEHPWIAKAFPLTVDGLAFIALRRGPAGRWWLALGIAVSVAANVAAAEPTVIGRLVAAWPPLSLLGCHRLLHGRNTEPGRS